VNDAYILSEVALVIFLDGGPGSPNINHVFKLLSFDIMSLRACFTMYRSFLSNLIDSLFHTNYVPFLKLFGR
jgi:hypothetical protein